jgi:flagellar biosynthesis protein FliP
VTPALLVAGSTSWAANPLTTVLTLSLLSLLPFLLMMSTSFV